MSAYKQAGISLTKYMAISARTVRSALKADIRAVAERRGVSEAKVIKYEKGAASEAKALEN